mmetsp:Transcript_8705/g.19970  ORF Transcript_8705/g.19970 Transcript_8705/m.19970 type:complete len:481 (-) Transcript_8705:193-1635(-)
MWRRLGADDAVLVEVDLRGVSLPQRRLQPPHVPRHHRRRSATQPRQLGCSGVGAKPAAGGLVGAHRHALCRTHVQRARVHDAGLRVVVAVDAEEVPVVDQPVEGRALGLEVQHPLEHLLRLLPLPKLQQQDPVFGEGGKVLGAPLEDAPVVALGFARPSADEVLDDGEEVEAVEVVVVDLHDPVQHVHRPVDALAPRDAKLLPEGQEHVGVVDEDRHVVGGVFEGGFEALLRRQRVALDVEQDAPVLVQRVHVRRPQLERAEEEVLRLVVVARLLQQRPVPRQHVDLAGVLEEGSLEELLGLLRTLSHNEEKVGEVAERGHVLGVGGQRAPVHVLGLVGLVPVVLQQPPVVVQRARVVPIQLEGSLETHDNLRPLLSELERLRLFAHLICRRVSGADGGGHGHVEAAQQRRLLRSGVEHEVEGHPRTQRQPRPPHHPPAERGLPAARVAPDPSPLPPAVHGRCDLSLSYPEPRPQPSHVL